MTIPNVPPDRQPGYRLTADDDWNQILSVLRRQQDQPGMFSDVTGDYARRLSAIGTFELVTFQIDGAYTNATVLDCTLGVWNASTHADAYTGAAAKCIDRRANVPDPDTNATGVGYWRPSEDHKRIIYILDLDCPA